MRFRWIKKPLTPEQNRIIDFILVITFTIIVISIYMLIYLFNLYFGHMQISCTEEFDKDVYIAEIQQLPEEIKKSFIINMGTVSIENQRFIDYKAETDKNAVGIYGGDRIWLKDSNATLHEFGHYVHDHLNDSYKARIDRCYEKEGTQCFDSRQLSNRKEYILDNNQIMTVYLRDNEMIGYSKRVETYPADEMYVDFIENNNTFTKEYPTLGQYATTSNKEYFADYFRYWFKNRDNIDEMEKLRKVTPDTFKLFKDLEDNNWGMCETLREKMLDKLVTIKYE